MSTTASAGLGTSARTPKERKSFKLLLTKEQCVALETYFTKVNKKPQTKEKIDLAKKHNIDPYLLNRWFQSQRNKDSKKKSKDLESNKSSTDIDVDMNYHTNNIIHTDQSKNMHAHIDINICS